MRKSLVLFALICFGLSANEAYLEVDKGKVFIRSNPTGAVVKLKDKTLGTTPCMIALPVGKHVVKLTKVAYRDKLVNLDVKDTSILKPAVVQLQNAMCRVDVIFLEEEGWEIYVDGKPYKEKGKTLTAPATIKVTAGDHRIELRKGDKVRGVDVPAIDGMIMDMKKVKVKTKGRQKTKTSLDNFVIQNWCRELSLYHHTVPGQLSVEKENQSFLINGNSTIDTSVVMGKRCGHFGKAIITKPMAAGHLSGLSFSVSDIKRTKTSYVYVIMSATKTSYVHLEPSSDFVISFAVAGNKISILQGKKIIGSFEGEVVSVGIGVTVRYKTDNVGLRVTPSYEQAHTTRRR